VRRDGSDGVIGAAGDARGDGKEVGFWEAWGSEQRAGRQLDEPQLVSRQLETAATYNPKLPKAGTPNVNPKATPTAISQQPIQSKTLPTPKALTSARRRDLWWGC